MYDALHLISGDEGEDEGFEQVRLHVLAVCYDLRHAMMGNRDARLVPKGLDRDKMRHLSIVEPESNVYYQFEVLWPEVLFMVFSLNELIELSEKKRLASQAAVASCLQETLSEKKFMMQHWHRSFHQCATQYIDELIGN